MTDNQKYLAASFSITGTAAGLVIATEIPANAAASPEVVAVVEMAVDTVPVLTGVCMVVFGAGLAPWAARTTLSWLSSIMKGAI